MEKFQKNGGSHWDLFILILVTVLGLVFSLEKFLSPKGQWVKRSYASMEIPILQGQVLDLGCLKESLEARKLSSEERMLRVQGKFCSESPLQKQQIQKVTVKNISNGYEGTVFFQGSTEQFTTDFLVLQGGKNTIQIQWQEKGTKPQSLKAEVLQAIR